MVILIYLVVGVLAAEKLIDWLNELPPEWGKPLGGAVMFGYEWNPFTWCGTGSRPMRWAGSPTSG